MNRDYSCQKCGSSQTSITDDRVHKCFECGFKFIVEPPISKSKKRAIKSAYDVMGNIMITAPNINWGVDVARTVDMSHQDRRAETNTEARISFAQEPITIAEHIDREVSRHARDSWNEYVDSYYQGYVRPDIGSMSRATESTRYNTRLEEEILRNTTVRMEGLPF